MSGSKFEPRCPERNSQCPSELALDRFVLGELDNEERDVIARRRAECTTCHARLAERESGFDQFPDLDAERVFELAKYEADRPAQVIALRKRLIAPAVVSGLLVAAAALFFLVPGDRPEEAGGARLKGSLALRVHRATVSGSEVLESGATFSPGDRLRFEVDLPSAGFVTVFGVESSGAEYRAWPPRADGRPLEAGMGQLLEGAVELDNSTGTERLYLVACERSAGAARCEIVNGAPVCQPGCTQASFDMEKAAP